MPTGPGGRAPSLGPPRIRPGGGAGPPRLTALDARRKPGPTGAEPRDAKTVARLASWFASPQPPNPHRPLPRRDRTDAERDGATSFLRRRQGAAARHG